MKNNLQKQVEKKIVNDSKRFIMRVTDNFFQRIDRHVRALKLIEKRRHLSKSDWILQAIQEKISREKGFNPLDTPKEKHINIALDDSLREKLEQRIEMIKKFKHGFTKKQWIVEAIQEKLEYEEKKVRESLEMIHNE